MSNSQTHFPRFSVRHANNDEKIADASDGRFATKAGKELLKAPKQCNANYWQPTKNVGAPVPQSKRLALEQQARHAQEAAARGKIKDAQGRAGNVAAHRQGLNREQLQARAVQAARNGEKTFSVKVSADVATTDEIILEVAEEQPRKVAASGPEPQVTKTERDAIAAANRSYWSSKNVVQASSIQLRQQPIMQEDRSVSVPKGPNVTRFTPKNL